ncbi:hypothetical protein CDES_03030 [Corynebacterium deserti GIMN1.010]|uniref:Uncharacterized protein n=1 Tax=Corynebacterium deserti GIMN1.010 TaxID=931089 RepID=A0A0M3Q953_9CORY|nr:hypothetical protein [Corynebacterium deserti]ALC05059.1 hypothetical protein CDES_03030 [Corynebacterium deserti GIMN1.010]
MKDLIAGYGTAVLALEQASRGYYRGPALSEQFLRGVYRNIDGLDTDMLREAARLATGETETAETKGWIKPVLDFVASVAAGMIATELIDRALDWFRSRDDAEEVSDAAGKAADTIDTTVRESDEGLEQIISQLLDVLTSLIQVMGSINPQQYPQEFGSCVQSGADLIDQAGAMIHGMCTDRDDAICQCFDALTAHGQRACAQPTPLCDAASHPTTPASTGGTGSTSSTAGVGASAAGDVGCDVGGDTKTQAAGVDSAVKPEDKPVEKQVENLAEPSKDVSTAKTPAEENPVDCDTKVEQNIGEPDPTHIENDVEGTMIGGALGIGLLIVGVTIVVDFLERAYEQFVSEQVVPGSEPAPVPAPELAAVPEPAPKPVPAAASEPAAAPAPAPVAEPAPKPIPSTSSVQSAFTPVSHSVPSPAPTSSGISVRKAGGW